MGPLRPKSDFEKLKVSLIDLNGVLLPLHDCFLWEKSHQYGPTRPICPYRQLSFRQKLETILVLKHTSYKLYKKLNWPMQRLCMIPIAKVNGVHIIQ